MAQHKKILITVSNSLLEEVDLLAQQQNVNRSEFIREAMRLYIRDRKKQRRNELLKKGYEEMAKINLEIANACFEADCSQQQSYEEKISECE